MADRRPRARPTYLGPCCVCGGACPGEGAGILQLDLRCPTPGRGWGCLVCGLPADGAVAVVCAGCLPAVLALPDYQAGLRWACKGYPAKDGRVLIAELTEPFTHRDDWHASDPGAN
jgi:hypothetical protein